MGQNSPTEWFLLIDQATAQGQKNTQAGPYSAEQIQGLLDDGEILAQNKVTSERLKGEWITVSELVEALQAARQKDFHPPPRPTDIAQLAPGHPLPEGPDDPAYNLFEALQAAKERKTASKFTPPENPQWGEISRSRLRFPAQFWFVVAFSSIVITGIWGIVLLLKSGPETDSVTKNASIPKIVAIPVTSPSPVGNTTETKSAGTRPRPIPTDHYRPAPPRLAVVPPLETSSNTAPAEPSPSPEIDDKRQSDDYRDQESNSSSSSNENQASQSQGTPSENPEASTPTPPPTAPSEGGYPQENLTNSY